MYAIHINILRQSSRMLSSEASNGKQYEESGRHKYHYLWPTPYFPREQDFVQPRRPYNISVSTWMSLNNRLVLRGRSIVAANLEVINYSRYGKVYAPQNRTKNERKLSKYKNEHRKYKFF